ncbi:MAG: hypothetical protein LCH81_05700 [Bacteroidetes bacterium]|nr:hypothetical protein [Bacteroidota bacterium]
MIQGSLSKMDGIESMKGFYGMSPKSNAIFGAIAQAYYFLIGTGSIPARLLMRKNLGERAFSPFAFLLCVFFFIYYGFVPWDEDFPILGVVGVVGNLGASHFWGIESNLSRLILANIILNPCLWFIVWLIIKGFQHFKSVIKKVRNNQIEYSYYRGEGRYFEHRMKGKKWGFDIDERFIRMVIEPLAIFRVSFSIFILGILTGLAIYRWGDQANEINGYILIFLGWLTNLGLLATFSAVCLFLEEYGIMARIRDAALDLIDGEYDMAFVMKKKEELQSEREKQTDNVKIAEEVYQSNLNLAATMATMPVEPHEIKSLTAAKEISPTANDKIEIKQSSTKRKPGIYWIVSATVLILLLSTFAYWFKNNGLLKQTTVIENDEILNLLPKDLRDLSEANYSEKSQILYGKGFYEDALSNYPEFKGFWIHSNFGLFPFPSKKGIILLYNDIDNEVDPSYEIYFNSDQKDLYLSFLKKFPTIASIDDTSTEIRESPIFTDMYIIDRGYAKEVNKYCVEIEKR